MFHSQYDGKVSTKIPVGSRKTTNRCDPILSHSACAEPRGFAHVGIRQIGIRPGLDGPTFGPAERTFLAKEWGDDGPSSRLGPYRICMCIYIYIYIIYI